MVLELNAELFGLQALVISLLLIFAGITKWFSKNWAKPIVTSSGIIFLLFAIIDFILAIKQNLI